MNKYSDILGKPNKGLHKYRLGSIAIVDLLLTLLAAWLISFFGVPMSVSLFFLLLLSFILHAIFGVKTTSDTYFKSFY